MFHQTNKSLYCAMCGHNLHPVFRSFALCEDYRYRVLSHKSPKCRPMPPDHNQLRSIAAQVIRQQQQPRLIVRRESFSGCSIPLSFQGNSVRSKSAVRSPTATQNLYGSYRRPALRRLWLRIGFYCFSGLPIATILAIAFSRRFPLESRYSSQRKVPQLL